ncbi:protein MULTIPOLAR SPINDLE 1-like [Pistacia vera]|uniref:protein MULTIPOLAR SPINDLE 1-like n=1 Tax=Pistacia vera TaxID=55513 RepID=UPI00126393C4|nr:protein MULTIPOLAR SPINDLE 1-like [Pistacia vera]
MKIRWSSLGPLLIFLWSFATLFLRLEEPAEIFLCALYHHCCIVFTYVGCLIFLQAKEGNFANWSHQTLDFILESLHIDDNSQFCIQHLICKLASEAYIGQRVIFSVSQRISVVAESLLFSYPFDVAFPSMHECMFLMIQLIEFLTSDYLLTWSNSEFFEYVLGFGRVG